MLHFLQHYSKEFPWVAKTLYCQIHFWNINLSSVWHTRRILESREMTIYVSLELWRCFCMEMKNSSQKLPNCSIYSSKNLVGLILQNFWGVFKEDIAIEEDINQADIFLYDFDIVDGSMIGELARRSVGKHSITVRQLRYKSHICYVSIMNALFKAYRCSSCDQIVKTVQHLERQLATCTDRVTHVFPKNVYQLWETLFNNLDSFIIPYSDNQKVLKNMAKFNFESKCMQQDKFRDTDTTTWIGKHFPISVSISSNLIEQQISYAIPIPQLWLKYFLMLLMG